MSARILVVEDDDTVRLAVSKYLSMRGFGIRETGELAAARQLLHNECFDLVVLDLGLGAQDGLTLLKEIRAQGELPVIVMTGRSSPIDRAKGLELGADDYLPKPVFPRELAARVVGVLRRAGADTRGRAPAENGGASRSIKFREFTFDPVARSITAKDSAKRVLTTAESYLLEALIANGGKPVSRSELLRAIHVRDLLTSHRTVDVMVFNLRQKLERDPGSPELILSVRGRGYMFVGHIERQ